MTMLSDVYELHLASSGKLKLRAKARLAEGTPEAIFEACVLLHEAARTERRALESLPSCPAATRLGASIEECWCFVEGRDPPRAAEAWGQVLRDRRDVDEATADAMLSRLGPRYERARLDFARAVSASPALLTMRDAGSVAAALPAARTAARKELALVLAAFPGTTSFWWMGYRLAEADGDKKAAWDALTRARRLSPSNPRFEAMSLIVAAWALPLGAAEEHISGVRGSLDRAGAEVCLMYAYAEINLARKSSAAGRAPRYRRAREAVEAGLAQATSEGLRRNLKATQLLLDDLLAGRQPTVRILYLAGLGELAAMTEPRANVVDVLTMRVRQAA
jgi:tetratricopeptide (TPR) repeat protein